VFRRGGHAAADGGEADGPVKPAAAWWRGAWMVAVAIAAAPAFAQTRHRPLQPTEELELNMLTGQLADAKRDPKTKLEAAELLLTRTYPQAAEALKTFLSDAANQAAQLAVAEAIARRGAGAVEFIEPLLAMMTGTEPAVREPAARALVTYKDNGVIDRLIAIARDEKADKSVRMVTVAALRWLLDKRAVDSLVALLSDRDAEVRAAAADALARLTNIRAFGNNARRWRQWWDQNKTKPASEWLADLAENLAREKARLEGENAALRRRLAAAMMDLYAATAPAEQERMLLGLLKDPLPDVRLVGVRLADRRAQAGGKLGDELRTQARAMLAEAEPDLRGASAGLLGTLGDAASVPALLAQLKAEDAPPVKQALLTALGQFADPNAVAPVLAEVASKYEAVAAAAAAALGRMAAKSPLEPKARAEAVRTLLRCYSQSASAGDGAVLREAVLTAMGALADKQFSPALRRGLKDPAATVRLAAVKGLARLREDGLGDALVPLASDADRGVRQAVLEALELLALPKYMQTVLQRTDPAAEPDAGVRQRAWAVLMTLLGSADAAAIEDLCDGLADRKDAAAERIRVRQMLVAALKAAKSPKLPAAQRKLAAALMAAARPVEAAPLLGEAHALYAAANNPDAKAVWLEWVDALLRANDPTAYKTIAAADAEMFAAALGRLSDHLAALAGEAHYAAVAATGGEALRRLGGKLSEAQRAAIQSGVDDAKARQIADDRQRVGKLAAQLQAADAAVRAAAVAELKAMGDRAAKPLLLELQKAVGARQPSPDAERTILDVLAQIAPKLTNYDPKASVAERLQRINDWLKML